MPGRLIVIEDGAPTSYVRIGALQNPIFKRMLKTMSEILLMTGLGRKTDHNLQEVFRDEYAVIFLVLNQSDRMTGEY